MSCKQRRSVNNQAGMTLLEVMVALAIFSVAALALMKSLMLGGRESARLAEMLTASWIVENALLEKDRAALTRQPSVGGWLWQESAADGEDDAARIITVVRQDDPRTVIYQLALSDEDEHTP